MSLHRMIHTEHGIVFKWFLTTPSGSDGGYAPGCVAVDISGPTVYYNSGTLASSTWTSMGATTGALDAAFDLGKVIDGAGSAANALQVGDASDKLLVYAESGNVEITTTGTADLTITPDGGDIGLVGATAVTGALAVSTTLGVTGNATLAGDCAITGTLTAGTFAVSQLAVTDLTLDVALAASKTMTLTGAAGSTILTITAGDAVMSDGSLAITDADNAATLTVTNNTATTATGVFAFNSTAVSTGSAMALDASGITSGDALLISCTEATLTTGNYINCYDGAATDFEVGRYGAVTIAGLASTDMITVTTGDVQVDDGKVEIDTNEDDTTYVKRNQTTTTGPVVEIEATHAGDAELCLLIDANGTGAGGAMTIDHEGTADCLTLTSLAAAASIIKATCEATTGTALEVLSAANQTTSLVVVDGSTGDFLGATGVGLVNIACDGALAHANASCLNITYSGTGAATGLGTSLRIVDTGATSTSYAVYISAATGEALSVAVGTSIFAEQVEMSGGWKTTTGAFVCADAGATTMSINGGAANDTLDIGDTTDTDTRLNGTTAGKDFLWDASEDAVKIGTTATRAGATGDSTLSIFDGAAAPSGALANGITLYSEGGECKVLDAAGNSTTLSPHTERDGGVGDEWTFHSVNTVTGKVEHIEVGRLLKALAAKFDLTEFIHEYTQ